MPKRKTVLLKPPDGLFTKVQKVCDEPIFLLISRIDVGKNMHTVSPFLLKKTIESVAGDIEKCSKLRDGTVLILAKNSKQAEKLKKINKLSTDINISVTKHQFLNNSKGVVFSHDLVYMTDEDILAELKDQNVIAIRRLKKKYNGIEKDSGLFIFTFSTSKIPLEIELGYEISEVRPYIPAPLKCLQCFQFGHSSSRCDKNKKCINCGDDYHTQDNEKCTRTVRCVNCKSMEHNSISKKCPVFIKENEIQHIKVKSNVNIKEAHKIYKERFSSGFSFAAVLSPSKTCTCVCNCKEKLSTNKPTSELFESEEEPPEKLTIKDNSPSTSERSTRNSQVMIYG